MRFPWIKLLAFLVPALAGLLYLAAWLSPTKVVTRRLHSLLSSVEHKGVLSIEGMDRRTERFAAMLAPEFTIDAPSPLPRNHLPPPRAAGLLREFHQSITSCRITRESTTVTFPASGHAVVETLLTIDVRFGAGASRVVRYRTRLEFHKINRRWLLSAATLTPV